MTVGCSYFGSRVPRHVAADMADLAGRGFTGVLHTFSENDAQYYPDTMRRIVELSHAEGLTVQVNPWGVGLTFGGEAESLWTAGNLEACQVLDDGRMVGAACPNQPAYRAFLKRWADRAIDTGADAVFWDEPHWALPHQLGVSAERWGCRCRSCQERFSAEFGGAMPTELIPEVRAFRDACLSEMVRELVAYVAEQGVDATVCLLPILDEPHGAGDAEAPEAPEASVGIVDWEGVASAPGLTTLATDPYWKVFGKDAKAFTAAATERTVALARAHGARPQIWIQGFRLAAEDVDDVRAAVAAARDGGVDDLWVWGYEACAHMSYLRPDDPEVVWEAIVEALVGVESAAQGP